MFTPETSVTMPQMGTYMAVKEVCDHVVLTCENWEDYNLMKEENRLTPEHLITYLGDGLIPAVGAAELPLKHLTETALKETTEAIEK